MNVRAVEIPRPREATLIDLNLPEPGNDEILVEVGATGICGSDLGAYMGHHPFRIPPVVTGHEVSGIVRRVGSEVEEPKIGDRVIIEPQVGCGRCTHCRDGEYHMCLAKRVLGTPAWPGSFAEAIVVPARCAYPIPDELSLAQAVLIEPLAVAVHAVAQSGLESGATVAILGAGTIGLALLLAVQQTRPASVFCSDLKDGNLSVALDLGATDALSADRDPVAERVLTATGGRGVDATFLVVPSDGVAAQALALTRRRGRIVVVATFGGPSQFDLRQVQLHERQLIGTCMYLPHDYRAATDLALKRRRAVERLITHRIALEDLPDTLSRLANGTQPGAIKVVVERAPSLTESVSS